MSSFKLKIHRFAGSIICRVMSVGWDIRDLLSKPDEASVLFVAHPDDDTLFFHTYIKEKKPYVVVLSGCSSVNRLFSFRKNMKNYGVRYRGYDLDTDDFNEELLKRRIKKILRNGSFKECASHNEEGEYGHMMHKLVHKAVAECVDCKFICPADKESIKENRLLEAVISEKVAIFKEIYTSELFVLDLYMTWIECEKLIEGY